MRNINPCRFETSSALPIFLISFSSIFFSLLHCNIGTPRLLCLLIKQLPLTEGVFGCVKACGCFSIRRATQVDFGGVFALNIPLLADISSWTSPSVLWAFHTLVVHECVEEYCQHYKKAE